MSMWDRKPRKYERSAGEDAGEVFRKKIGLWSIPFKVIAGAIKRFFYGGAALLHTTIGRVILFAVVAAMMLDAAFGSDGVGIPILGGLGWVALFVYGCFAWSRRSRWEEHLEAIVHEAVPGHSGRVPAVVWYPPRPLRLLHGGRWLGRYNFAFRIPGAMDASDEIKASGRLRSRLPTARGSTWGFNWDWPRGVCQATLKVDLPGRDDAPLRKSDVPAPAAWTKKVTKKAKSNGSGPGVSAPRGANTEEAEKAATKIPLGKSREMEIIWDCSNLYGCILVAGAPGGGKSVVTLTILAHCFAHAFWWRVYAIDLKRVELGPLRRFMPRPVRRVATDLESSLGVLEEVQAKMERRYEMMESEGFNNIRKLNNARRARSEKRLPHVMVAMDEIAELVEEQGGKENKEEDEMRRACKKRVNSIVRLGRAAGVHMILATQRPDAEYIPGATKSNIQARVALGGLSRTGSEMTIEDEAASKLPGVPGRGIWFESGRLTEFQGFLTEDEDLDALVPAAGKPSGNGSSRSHQEARQGDRPRRRPGDGGL